MGVELSFCRGICQLRQTLKFFPLSLYLWGFDVVILILTPMSILILILTLTTISGSDSDLESSI